MSNVSNESPDLTNKEDKDLSGLDVPFENRAVGIPEAREILGEDAKDLSDEEVERMINLFYLVASVA